MLNTDPSDQYSPHHNERRLFSHTFPTGHYGVLIFSEPTNTISI